LARFSLEPNVAGGRPRPRPEDSIGIDGPLIHRSRAVNARSRLLYRLFQSINFRAGSPTRRFDPIPQRNWGDCPLVSMIGPAAPIVLGRQAGTHNVSLVKMAPAGFADADSRQGPTRFSRKVPRRAVHATADDRQSATLPASEARTRWKARESKPQSAPPAYRRPAGAGGPELLIPRSDRAEPARKRTSPIPGRRWATGGPCTITLIPVRGLCACKEPGSVIETCWSRLGPPHFCVLAAIGAEGVNPYLRFRDAGNMEGRVRPGPWR